MSGPEMIINERSRAAMEILPKLMEYLITLVYFLCISNKDYILVGTVRLFCSQKKAPVQER